MNTGTSKGILYAFGAYGLWGVFPIYFKLIQAAPPLQILGHRIVWSVVFLALILSLMRGWRGFAQTLTPKIVAVYLVAALLLAANWYVYIWAVNNGFIVEASLGYFINPLVNVLLGVVFLKERLKRYQAVSIGLAALGVTYLTISYGSLPWISLALALTFGFYGLFKKLAPLSSLNGLSLETAILFLPALAYLLTQNSAGAGAFAHNGPMLDALLAFSGVLTAIPLLMFASAAHRIPLTTMGLIQYCAPTLQFLIGVFLYREPFTSEKMVGFGIIWLALFIYSAWGLARRASERNSAENHVHQSAKAK